MSSAAEPLKVFCRHCHQKLDVSLLPAYSMVQCPVCGTMLRIPERFDRYLLEKICGVGGMSNVYRAIEPALMRRVAVKILKDEFIGDQDFGQRFLEESKLVAQVNHPGVIPIYNCGVFEKRPFLVMRYMENGSLEQMVKDRKVPEIVEGLTWILNITKGLNEALRYNIVHHDVKPGNILLTSDNEAKLGDFDLADIRDGSDRYKLIVDNWGSPAYVSPERLMYGSEGVYGDIFSMGVTIYELFSSRVPFGVSGEAEVLLDRRKSGEYMRLAELAPAVPAAVSALVDKMLLYEPESRPSYPEIIAVLEESIMEQSPDGDNK